MIPKKLQNRSMATLKTPYQGEMGTWLWQELHASALFYNLTLSRPRPFLHIYISVY